MEPRFYAPWCGHCRNLKPDYEKAAKGLKDLAQVAAVNCDEENNKAFCGSMGVQGFPTLKIVKPAKKPGNRGIVEDYNGPRESKGIVEAVKSAIPNNVKRITEESLSAWLEKGDDTPKAILFSNKGTTGALIKVIATEYLGKISFAQIRDKETKAVEQFGISEYPTLIILPGGSTEPVKYDGAFSRTAMKDFLSQYAPALEEKGDSKQKPIIDKAKHAAKSKSASSTFSEASASHASAEASEAAARATSVTLEGESNPTESPEPAVTPEAKPIVVPQHEPIPALIEEKFLQQKCLGEKSSTCVLALLPKVEGDDTVLPEHATTALASLAELAHKHKERACKLFPILSVPSRNAGSATLRDALKLGGETDFEMIAVNARRSWFRRFEGDEFGSQAVETWVDNIRFGEGPKGVLPESLIVAEAVEEKETSGMSIDIEDLQEPVAPTEAVEIEHPEEPSEETAPAAPTEEASAAPTHSEL